MKGNSKKEFYNNIKYLNPENINNQHKTNILNIKNSLSHNLDPSSFNQKENFIDQMAQLKYMQMVIQNIG